MITSLSNFSGIQKEIDIAIITLDDNKIHTYCYSISWQKDNLTPIGIAKLKMPYSPVIEEYWVKYSGAVIIHANFNNKQKIINNKYIDIKHPSEREVIKKKENNKIRIQNDEYNYSFIGKVHKFKQEGKKFILYLEDLGWKFLQKVPDEFRKTYIAGQTLDNAFQAICEFMNVDFAYSIEKLSEYNFASDGFSIEKDGSIIEDVPSIFEGTTNNEEDEEEEKTEDQKMADRLDDNQSFEASGLISYKKQQENKNQANNQSNNQAINQSITNSRTNENTDDKKVDENNPKINQYQEEFDEKIKDLFKGNTFYDSNISDSILNYNSISITPTTQSSETTTDTNTTEEEANNEGVSTDTSENSQLDAENQ